VKLALLLLGLILAVQSAHAQERKPWSVGQICGLVEYVHQIPEKKHPNNYSEKRKSLRGVPMELYESGENQTCCDGLKSLGSVISGRKGEFEFRPNQSGHYWLTAKWNGKDYKIDVVYEPQKKSSTICSGQGIQIVDDQDASWWVRVTVD
jgi:hypothetical protein